MDKEIYDVAIVGCGPAGMSAGLYCARANMKTAVIEKECPGGNMLKAKSIDNYIAGNNDPYELAGDMFNQMTDAGVDYIEGSVVSLNTDEFIKILTLSDGTEINAKAIILAMGGRVSSTNFKYDSYLNKGLSYCVVCDGSFYKDKIVALIGDDKSVESAEYLANIASKVYFINKQSKTANLDNVINYPLTQDFEILGKDKVESIKIKDQLLPIDGVFYEIKENSLSGFVNKLDVDKGFIVVDKYMHTNIDGVFAAGDVINLNVKQVITACANGAIAALESIKYINKNKSAK